MTTHSELTEHLNEVPNSRGKNGVPITLADDAVSLILEEIKNLRESIENKVRQEGSQENQKPILEEIETLREEIKQKAGEYKQKGFQEKMPEFAKLNVLLQRIERQSLRTISQQDLDEQKRLGKQDKQNLKIRNQRKLKELGSLVHSLDIALAALSQEKPSEDEGTNSSNHEDSASSSTVLEDLKLVDPFSPPSPEKSQEQSSIQIVDHLIVDVEQEIVRHEYAFIDRQSVLANIERLREKLRSEVKRYDQKDIEEALQKEIAEFAVLLQRTERVALKTRNEHKLRVLNNLVCSSRVGITSLSQEVPNMRLAEQIRIDVNQEVVKSECFWEWGRFVNLSTYIWRSPSTPLKVIYGLIFSFVIIFGGLSSLAVFQYTIYRLSTAEERSIQLSINDQTNRREELYKELDQLENNLAGLAKQQLEVRASLLSKLRSDIKAVDGRIPELQKQRNAMRFGAEYVKIEELINEQKQQKKQLGDELKQEEGKGFKNLINAEVQDRNSKLTMLRQAVQVADSNINTLENQKLNILKKEDTGVKKFLLEVRYFFSSFDPKTASFINQMLWVAAAGTLGSIISILIRVIEGFDNEEYRDRLTPFFIGFFKPLIGASFGVLFLAFINSGMVSKPLNTESVNTPPSPSQEVEIAKSNRYFFLFAVAFIVGFSERLAKDTINKLDGTSSEPKKDSK